MKVFQSILLILFLAFICFSSKATHIRAGQITAERISQVALTYRFTLTTYTDDNGQAPPDPTATLVFGGIGQLTSPRGPFKSVGNSTTENKYIFIFDFPGAGTYNVSYVEENRNGCVINMTTADQTPFSVETIIVIDPFLGINNTPILLNPPIDIADVGQKFIHNPGAFDPDGDSLSFKMTIPKRSANQEVLGYQPLESFLGPAEEGGNPSFSLDPVTGTLTWDTPSTKGCFNIAFIVEEWRDGVKLGQVVRDMQIIVDETNNKRPILELPKDTCVIAGTNLNVIIKASDANNDKITLSSTSGIYENGFPSPATFVPNAPQPQDNPASGTFDWNTICDHIRAQPYQVLFKAEDHPLAPAKNLTDIKTWQVTVVGPKPTGLVAVPAPKKSMLLNWDPYSCPNVKEIIIWRKVGCSDWEPSNCELGVPGYTGYVEVGRVAGNITNFLDNNNGKGLKVGSKYSYRISAVFPDPKGGESYASEESCVYLPLDIPLIINVSVDITAPTDGQITVKWIKPLEINMVDFPPPYTYTLFRAEGLNGNNFTQVFSTSDENNLFYVDKAPEINTLDKAYTYRLALYYGNNNDFKDSSEVASSVRLKASPAPSSIILDWEYNVPWSNEGFKHKIYRKVNDVFTFIDEVEVGIPKYIDKGKFNNEKLVEDSLYCYYVETVGSYKNPIVDNYIGQLLVNKSQEVCASPLDTIPPCPPILNIVAVDCANFDINAPLANKLHWMNVIADTCDNSDIDYYNLYYRPTDTGDFTLLVSIPDTFYVHANLTSLAGCYVVTAVDKSKNESKYSNVVCVDNCIYYELPNVFTPNGDGKNDVFQPFPTPRFVESVEFTVFNRWGKKVFERKDDILLNWNGSDKFGESSGPTLSTGVYYYVAKVKFITLRPSESVKELKGWIQLMK